MSKNVQKHTFLPFSQFATFPYSDIVKMYLYLLHFLSFLLETFRIRNKYLNILMRKDLSEWLRLPWQHGYRGNTAATRQQLFLIRSAGDLHVLTSHCSLSHCCSLTLLSLFLTRAATGPWECNADYM